VEKNQELGGNKGADKGFQKPTDHERKTTKEEKRREARATPQSLIEIGAKGGNDQRQAGKTAVPRPQILTKHTEKEKGENGADRKEGSKESQGA